MLLQQQSQYSRSGGGSEQVKILIICDANFGLENFPNNNNNNNK